MSTAPAEMMADQEAGQVILFGGHMVDLPDRPEPRFPPRAVDAAGTAIGRALDRLLAEGPQPAIAASSAARGGDLLFLEACRARGLVYHVVLPFAPGRFLETSVRGAEGGDWVGRFKALWAHTPHTRRLILDTRDAVNPYAVCNQSLVDLARRLGGKLSLLVLWNGCGGDGPGGTASLVERVRDAGGEVERIDSEALLRSLNGAAKEESEA